MSADAAREFVDANILVYAFDTSAGPKHAAARALLERLWRDEAGSLSVQVLQEFFVTVTKKVPHPLSADAAAAHVRAFSAWAVFSPTADDVLSAITLQQRAKISFWDAMIVVAASESGCGVLWTEDLTHDQQLLHVRVRNPFLSER